MTKAFFKKAAAKLVIIVGRIKPFTEIADIIHWESGFVGAIIIWRRIKVDKTAQHKKGSFLKTRLGGFTRKLGKRPQKLKKAILGTGKADRSATQSAISAKSAPSQQNRHGFGSLGKDRFSGVPEKHVKKEKQEKAIRHVEKLLEQIKQLQDEIDNSLQTEVCLEDEIINLMTANKPSQHQVAEPDYKNQADVLPAANGPFHEKRERPKKNTKYDDNHHANRRKVSKKICRKCKKQKAKSDFHRDRSCKDGLARWCKECKAKAARKYRKKQKASPVTGLSWPIKSENNILPWTVMDKKRVLLTAHREA